MVSHSQLTSILISLLVTLPVHQCGVVIFPLANIPNETDLMYEDQTAADGNDTVAEIEEEITTEAQDPAPEQVVEEVPLPVLDRP